MEKGSVALVTGAAGALGGAVAQTLAQNGYKVALVDRAANPAGRETLDQLAASLRGYAVAGDISLESTWAEAMPRIVRELGQSPSVAALAAGAWAGGTPLHEETNDETWHAMLTANLETAHRSLRAVLPPMVAMRRGSVVVVGSRAGDRPETGARATAYAASKAAVVALAQATAAEVCLLAERPGERHPRGSRADLRPSVIVGAITAGRTSGDQRSHLRRPNSEGVLLAPA
jgi:NAD(P)-dependent dehydrogenase (short-subunit alcohol dehydrogenase family)